MKTSAKRSRLNHAKEIFKSFPKILCRFIDLIPPSHVCRAQDINKACSFNLPDFCLIFMTIKISIGSYFLIFLFINLGLLHHLIPLETARIFCWILIDVLYLDVY